MEKFLKSEIEFIKFVLKEYEPRNRLEEKDKQQILFILEKESQEELVDVPVNKKGEEEFKKRQKDFEKSQKE